MTVVQRLKDISERLPAGTMIVLNVDEVRGWLEEQPPELKQVEEPISSNAKGEDSWAERIWTVPPETRLTARQLAEVVGRSIRWVYARTNMSDAELRIPHRRMDGGLVFRAGEIRDWLNQREEVVVPFRRRSW